MDPIMDVETKAYMYTASFEQTPGLLRAGCGPDTPFRQRVRDSLIVLPAVGNAAIVEGLAC